MVQGYTQEGCGSSSGWYSPGNRNLISESFGTFTGFFSGFEGFYTYPDRPAYQQWFTYPTEEFKLSIASFIGGEVGGSMLNVTGLNHFYYIRNFTDMRCKHPRVLSVIREQLRREPSMVMCLFLCPKTVELFVCSVLTNVLIACLKRSLFPVTSS